MPKSAFTGTGWPLISAGRKIHCLRASSNGGLTKETFLALHVKLADSFGARLVGLLGRRSLKPESGGVWIIPGNSIHTIGMLSTIDVVFLQQNSKYVGLRGLVRPFSITRPNFRSRTAVEVPPPTIYK